MIWIPTTSRKEYNAIALSKETSYEKSSIDIS
jgi:hypothetical protein